MSNPVNINGRTLGSSNGQDQDFEVLRENQSLMKRYPTTYNTAAEKMSEGGERVRSATYPLNGGNNHYIRFFINLSEESKLIQLGKVSVSKTADLTGQNRPFQNTTDQRSVDTAVNAAGIVTGTGLVAATGLKKLFLSKYGLAAIGTATIAGSTPQTPGSAEPAGVNVVGELVSDYLKVTNRLKTLAANITLYTPANVKANYRLNYDMPEDLLVILAQSENYEAAKAGLSALGSPMSDITGGSLTDSQNWSAAGNTAGKFGRIIATGASKTVSMLSRTAINKRRDVMFTHVGNRTFNFNYTFAPRSITEAKEVDDIIFMFKYFAHPEMLPGYGNFLYLYPAEFDIEYGLVQNNPDVGSANETPNKFLNRISSCVLTEVDVNYSPGEAYQSLENGEPLITNLSLSFMEIETLHRDRIGAGF